MFGLNITRCQAILQLRFDREQMFHRMGFVDPVLEQLDRDQHEQVDSDAYSYQWEAEYYNDYLKGHDKTPLKLIVDDEELSILKSKELAKRDRFWRKEKWYAEQEQRKAKLGSIDVKGESSVTRAYGAPPASLPDPMPLSSKRTRKTRHGVVLTDLTDYKND